MERNSNNSKLKLYNIRNVKKALKKNEPIYFVDTLKAIKILNDVGKTATYIDLKNCDNEKTVYETLKFMEGGKFYLITNFSINDNLNSTPKEKQQGKYFANTVRIIASEIHLLFYGDFLKENEEIKEYKTFIDFFNIFYKKDKQRGEEIWNDFIKFSETIYL